MRTVSCGRKYVRLAEQAANNWLLSSGMVLCQTRRDNSGEYDPVEGVAADLPDRRCVLRISMNQGWESKKDLSMTALASRLLNLRLGRN